MSLLRVAARALTLLDDSLDRDNGGAQAGHRHELGPAERRLGRLRPGRADEQSILAELVCKVTKTPLDPAIEVANGCEVLKEWDDLVSGACGRGREVRDESGRTTPASVNLRGSAYNCATRGMRRWNAVSKHATCGSPGRARLTASIAPIACGR